ncbi:MAG: hypothetical protein IPQ09_18735 [Myxococcales bacterium]|nr:hypothetical protein [Myxococcales bacterium]
MHSAPGPSAAPSGERREPITRDGLTCAWSAQRKRGHRHSTDDVLTAAYALEPAARPTTRPRSTSRAGIGTVGLLVLWGPGDARLVGVEARR